MSKFISNIRQLGFLWETRNPFLFCAHHLDKFPAGNDEMEPDVHTLEGRNIGMDFTDIDGWKMYHGDIVPGFPMHPHRGFETVTIVLQGFVDHSDSHGAGGRYGQGDVQWMTAGSGLQHSEMFPLLNKDKPNTTELFQVWLNLPKDKKMCEPHYKMLWAEDIPIFTEKDKNGKKTDVRVIAGKIANVNALAPAPDSWAENSENEVGIWVINMEAGAEWTLPKASGDINRTLYFYHGGTLNIAGESFTSGYSMELNPEEPVELKNGEMETHCLVLQGKPINEPVVQHGPFVMNNEAEIHQAITDYQHTLFGGWPWDMPGNVFPRNKGRFARYADGKEEIK